MTIFRGAVLKNQLIEKEMKEQNAHQRKKFNDIKNRTALIRKTYEEQQKLSTVSAFTPQTYAQGLYFLCSLKYLLFDLFLLEEIVGEFIVLINLLMFIQIFQFLFSKNVL